LNGRRVLLVSYTFPPAGGGGVQRPMKFAKYLRDFHWNVSVLTVSNPSIPVVDHSLLSELPADLEIVRARTFEPSYQFKQAVRNSSPLPQNFFSSFRNKIKSFFYGMAWSVLQPDSQVLWLPSAFDAASKLLTSTKHHVILTTAPPYSSLLLGTLLKKKFHLPLVVDFRDEWGISQSYLENAKTDHFSKYLQGKMLDWVLRNTDSIIATTQASADELQRQAKRLGNDPMAKCIYNGFDENDFCKDVYASTTKDERFRIVYAGTLWNLTSIEPFVAVLEQLKQRAPTVANKIELVCVGRKTSEQLFFLRRIQKLACHVVSEEYCEHHKAIEIMCSAHALLLLLSDVPEAERVVSAKLFEYLATGKPIIALVPRGETTELLDEFHHAHFHPRDTEQIAEWLIKIVGTTHNGNQLPLSPSKYTRKNQTAELAEILTRVSYVCSR